MRVEICDVCGRTVESGLARLAASVTEGGMCLLTGPRDVVEACFICRDAFRLRLTDAVQEVLEALHDVTMTIGRPEWPTQAQADAQLGADGIRGPQDGVVALPVEAVCTCGHLEVQHGRHAVEALIHGRFFERYACLAATGPVEICACREFVAATAPEVQAPKEDLAGFVAAAQTMNAALAEALAPVPTTHLAEHWQDDAVNTHPK